jgi:general secretion pathway protein G
VKLNYTDVSQTAPKGVKLVKDYNFSRQRRNFSEGSVQGAVLMEKEKSRSRAFSLMELMIVIVILGLLMAIVGPNLIGKGEEAKEKTVCIQMKNLANAIKMFKLDIGRYPTTGEGLNVLIKNTGGIEGYPKTGYLDEGKMPVDPWHGKYIYVEEGNAFDIVSFGSDKREGTGDDIRYKNCK